MIKMIQLNCRRCGKEFSKKAALHKGELKAGRTNFHCSRKCADYRPEKRFTTKCNNCNKEFNRTYASCKKSKLYFCSRSCGALFYNKPMGQCKTCQKPILSERKFCKDCLSTIRKNKWSTKTTNLEKPINTLENKTIKDLITPNGKSSKHSHLRQHARKVISNRPKICEKCEYSKYVECCHIKPVSDFTEDTLVSVVNHPDNLKWLCPNCHHEHDEKLKQLRKLNSNQQFSCEKPVYETGTDTNF